MNNCDAANCNKIAVWRDAEGDEWCDEHRHSLVARIDRVQGVDYDAVNFGKSWKAVVFGHVQRPDFQDKGSALAFAKPVAEGKRKPEPVE